jgi:hypothetical protein
MKVDGILVFIEIYLSTRSRFSQFFTMVSLPQSKNLDFWELLKIKYFQLHHSHFLSD